MNPYVYALRVMLQRLRWDLRIESWRSRRKLVAMRGIKSGGKCVILCNGPSLRAVDLKSLAGVDTIGMNKLNLLFGETAFRPTYMACVDHLILAQNKTFFNETEIPLFLDYRAIRMIPPRSNITYLHTSAQRLFGGDISLSLQIGGTVTNVALQIAYHLGYKEVAIVGCDHHFPNTAIPSCTEERSDHFVKGYYKKGERNAPPDLDMVEFSMKRIADLYRNNGRALYNCTKGGKLEILPRMELADFLDHRNEA